MAYKYTTGSVKRDDIYYEGDSQKNTYIDWQEDYIGLVAGGSSILVVSGSKVGIGTDSPDCTLHAYADASDAYVVLIDNDAGSNSHGLKVTSDGTGTGTTILDIEAGSTTVFKVRGDGRVGIGVATPGSTLSVDDEIAVGEKLIHRGDPDTYLQFPSNNEINLVAAGHSFLKYDSGNILINNANQDSDTQIMADDGNVVLHVDAGDNRVGIGTTAPEAYLDIKNIIDDGATNRTMIQMYNYRADDADENDWAPTSIDFKIENVAGGVKGATARIATVIAPVGTEHNSTEGEKSSALMFSTMDDGTLSEAMRINNLGSLGIGTDNPTSTLGVSGSVAAKISSITGTSNTIGATYTILMGSDDNVCAAQLPASADCTGRIYIFKRLGSSACKVQSNGSENIENSTDDLELSTQYDTYTIQSDGTEWWVIGAKIS